MSQNHHAQSKYDKSETWSAVMVYSIKWSVSLGETMNSEIYVSFPLVNYLGKLVPDLRIEANYTSLPELMQTLFGYITDTNHVKISLSLQELEDII